METIKQLFDPKKDIYRSIEKVITYDASQDRRLKNEISEYVVTESIEEQFEKLLTKMQTAMEAGNENDVGVWVSGFYGSGKSSFTKYLGLALDERVQIDGTPFINYLQDRLNKPQTKALLTTVAKRFPAAVIMLDLASEMLAGATMQEVSTVLYYKVLQWAGYSRNLKVAAFERRLQKDGRYEAFLKKIEDQGLNWIDIQNDPLVVDSVIPPIAHEMYPEIFRTENAFNSEASDIITFENERVKEMIEIVYNKTGRSHIVFIIDEVGQYLGGRDNLILNLDGLAKNLKEIGQGKAWIIGTAQQTLTEDDPRSAINAPELFKLKDRFPIQIDLESKDIKEICYRRLLGKASEGEKVLGEYFDNHGQALRHNTKLQDAKYYDSDFNKETFINLYPFLPAHFDILLHLLGALAKSTGGIGLRSAIKVVQDILIEGPQGYEPMAEQPVGHLATTATLYDALERDIQRAFPSIHRSVGKAMMRFPDSDIHQDAAKSVAILQILNNLPVTAHNVASLMHRAIGSNSRADAVQNAIDEMIADAFVPFGEQEGSLCFFSEKLNDIEQERSNIPLRGIETRRILNDAIKEAFSPLPSTRIYTNLVVTTGLKSQIGNFNATLAGERETIQTQIELADAVDYDTNRDKLTEESRNRIANYTIFLLGKKLPEIDDKMAEIYRCQAIADQYRNDPEQEVRDYCKSQLQRAQKLIGELKSAIKKSLARGVFVFRGQAVAVESLNSDVIDACKKYLGDVGAQVFDRYNEAPERAGTDLAEKFLRLKNLNGVTAKTDPLGLVQVQGGKPQIQTDYPALVSIREYIDRNGSVEGKRLISHFTDAPFGWSQDTLRYLVAALLVAGVIKLNVSGKSITAVGQQAIDALKTNNAFKSVGVSLRETGPSMDVCVRAAERLTDIIGESVTPLEQDISEHAAKYLPQLQSRYASLESILTELELPGADRIQSLSQEIADLLYTDASDASQRLGGEESALYDNLKWAGAVDKAFKQGLKDTIKALQNHRRQINDLPATGVPGDLKYELAEEFARLKERLGSEDFYNHAPDLNSMLTNIKTSTRNAAIQMADAQADIIKSGEESIREIQEWRELTNEEQSSVLENIENLKLDAAQDLEGLKALVSHEYVINSRIKEIKEGVKQKGLWRRKERIQEEQQQQNQTTLKRSVKIPKKVTDISRLNELILEFQAIQSDLNIYSDIEVFIEIEDA